MFCSCGRPIPTLLSEVDADKKAIEDLTRQVKSQSGPMATLIKARRDQLKAEVKAEQAFAKALNKSTVDIAKAMETAIKQAVTGPNVAFTRSSTRDSSILSSRTNKDIRNTKNVTKYSKNGLIS